MYYSPLEQFEPIPYFFPFKLGFFYIFGTNVTYILILLLGIFFFINGSFWPIVNINKIYDNFYNNINRSNNLVSFIKIASLPFNYIIFFYKNIIFPLMFKGQNFLFNTVSTKISILLINYKINLFKSFTNYSISGNYNTMYTFIALKKLNTFDLSCILPYNFFSIKISQVSVINNYFFYFLRIYFFFFFFLKNWWKSYIIFF
jgi:hypothetical protein